MLGPGDTFYIPSPGTLTAHLWIVLTDVDQDGKAICVNITTKKDHSDTTTILQPGAHPFIEKESVAYYNKADWLDMKQLDLALSGGTMVPCSQRETCSMELLHRLRCGLLKSRMTKKRIKDHCIPLWSADCRS